jgi:hypothetical protein
MAKWNPKDKPQTPLDITSWRKMPPLEIYSRRKDFIAILAPLTVFADGADQELVTKASLGGIDAMVAVAETMRGMLDENDCDDLAWSWMAVAAAQVASFRSNAIGPAQVAVTAHLYGMARAARKDGRTSEAGRLLVLVRAWADLAYKGHDSLMISYVEKFGLAKIHARREEQAKKAKEADKKAKADEKDEGYVDAVVNGIDFNKAPSIVGHTLTVITGPIPEANGRSEDKALIKAWEPLTKPLPLAGGLDPDVLETVLLAEFPWLYDAVEAVVGDLRLRRSTGEAWAKFRPVLLVGPPATGKTRLARRIAEILGVGFGEVSAAGASDNRSLQGTARGWSTATPALPLIVIRQSGVANPVILVDELDKANGSHNGDIKQTLLTMLEPISAKAWPDDCLMTSANLSAVNWICTANDVTPLKGPLLTRLRVIEVPPPGIEHYDAVMAGMRRDLAVELGVRADDLPELPREVEDSLRQAFRRGHSLRRIKGALEGALRVGGEAIGGRMMH